MVLCVVLRVAHRGQKIKRGRPRAAECLPFFLLLVLRARGFYISWQTEILNIEMWFLYFLVEGNIKQRLPFWLCLCSSDLFFCVSVFFVCACPCNLIGLKMEKKDEKVIIWQDDGRNMLCICIYGCLY